LKMGKQKGKHVLGKLSAVQVTKLKEPRYYSDGGNLWLRVTQSGSKSWYLIYTVNGKTHQMGLGGLHKVSLDRARQKAAEARAKLGDGIDPVAERQANLDADRVAVARRVTFSEAAKSYIKAHTPTWQNAKHTAQWTNTLEKYAAPVIGDLPVAAVDTGLVMKILEPIWTTKTETATRVRQRIESVLDWATTQKLREGANPARWKGHLDNLLPAPTKVAAVQHHAALPFAEINGFVTDLRKQEGIAAKALEFLILCASRTSEVINAEWKEFDLNKGVWTIPAERMKAKKKHVVPLSPRAVEVIKSLLSECGGQYVFHGGKAGKPLSNGGMLSLLKRMNRNDLTSHGFRSTFRDWAAEKTIFQKEVCEMALAHTIGDAVEAAYRRGDLFDKRRKLMEAWATYIKTEQKHDDSNVITLRA
jgi:integrase